jgi:hypothetical protein
MLIIIKKVLNQLRFFYHKIVPISIRRKIRYFFLPPNEDGMVGNRIDNVLEVYKKKFAKKTDLNFDRSLHNYQNVGYLHKEFNKAGIRSNLIFKDWWKDFMRLDSLPRGQEFEKLNKSLINRIEKSNFSSLEYWEVINISTFSMAIGLVEIGYYLHKKAIKISLSYSSKLEKYKSWKLKSKLSALLEIKNYSEFDELIPLLENRLNMNYFGYIYPLKKRWRQEHHQLKFYQKILRYYDSISNNHDRLIINRTFNKFDNFQDAKFRNFIHNKKIAIVGPLAVQNKDGGEIDKADIVIRFNFFEDRNMCEKDIKDIKGSRTDISYINGARLNLIINNQIKNWHSNLSWLICKDKVSQDKILKKFSDQEQNLGSLNIRSIQNYNFASFKSNLVQLPNVVLDLARFSPLKISIFHCDLCLSTLKHLEYAKLIRKDYESFQPIGLAKNHDIFSSFTILKLFWSKGFIEGDKIFERIMKMEIEDYVSNYQAIYIDKVRAANLL